ncbi:hypothetical protein HK097_007914 [Rhizophlyctis rosea]|uniref:Uncharacterized protein n=1 Tax=Rhizophlyctis rosea TaxID=64517 RepID=A0AAD5X1Z5_9FUNG|nr:hypothetical protein HK097_007914 [Rhizophlyctis rosea]
MAVGVSTLDELLSLFVNYIIAPPLNFAFSLYNDFNSTTPPPYPPGYLGILGLLFTILRILRFVIDWLTRFADPPELTDDEYRRKMRSRKAHRLAAILELALLITTIATSNVPFLHPQSLTTIAAITFVTFELDVFVDNSIVPPSDPLDSFQIAADAYHLEDARKPLLRLSAILPYIFLWIIHSAYPSHTAPVATILLSVWIALLLYIFRKPEVIRTTFAIVPAIIIGQISLVIASSNAAHHWISFYPPWWNIYFILAHGMLASGALNIWFQMRLEGDPTIGSKKGSGKAPGKEDKEVALADIQVINSEQPGADENVERAMEKEDVQGIAKS